MASVNMKIPHASKNMNSSILLVTPKHAAQMLALNDGNRPISKQTTNKYADMMARGEWRLTGEPLIFGTNGKLLNGQHRLTACIRANVSFQSLIVYGAEPDVFNVLDSGKKRTAADVFAISGEKDYTTLAASVRAIWSIKQTELNQTDARSVFSFMPSVIELQQTLEDHPAIREWVTKASPLKKIADRSLMAALIYLFSLKHAEKASNFLDRLIDGAGLTAKHPILVLRDRLIVNKASTSNLPRLDIAALTIKAWNAYSQGKTMGVARWSPDEAFPKIL